MPNAITTGNVWKSIIAFSVPYLISYFLQTLYGMADLFIIGQFEGPASITAVAVGSQIMHMLTVMLVGLAMGTTVSIAQSVGAGNKERAARVTGNTVLLFMGLSIVLAILLIHQIDRIVGVMATPPEAVKGTTDYLFICFLGIPFITAYNLVSSIFRGLGNSRTPTYFIAIACIVNILLDFLFMGAFHMGPSGAALGTTLAQIFSVAISLFVMTSHNIGISVSRHDFHFDGSIMRDILKIGVPISVQDGLIQISFLIITMIANQRGVTDAAAVGIVEKIISFIFLVPSSLLSTVSALGAQNIGAGKPERAREFLYDAIKIAIGFGAVMIVLMQFAAYGFVGLFTGDESVVAAGGPYLKGYILDCLFAGIHFSFSGYFCACGKSIYSFIHNITAIACARVPLVYWASVNFPDNLLPMGLATSVGSLVSVVICIFLFRHLLLQEKKMQHCGV
ncbi:MAG: MATE family efflux transporter [Acidaminococcus sp.]|nr:MATE family efflux transporter [Acidaminococcus sp.]MCI2116003.1 MATE family efflux transporter [Acidaminococcus sp.]